MTKINYEKYASKCNEDIQDLKDLLNEDAIKELACFLKNFSRLEYFESVNTNYQLINAFLLATPSVRKRKGFCQDEPQYFRILVLASIQRAMAAHVHLQSIQDFALDTPHPYRLMCKEASQAYFQAFLLMGNPFSYWPFEDICESPFVS